MAKKPTKTEIIAYIRDQYFDEDEWDQLIEDIIRYRWLKMSRYKLYQYDDEAGWELMTTMKNKDEIISYLLMIRGEDLKLERR